MTEPWFDEQDYTEDYYPTPIYRCIQAELQWDAQAKVNEVCSLLANLEQRIMALVNELPDPHKRIDKLLDLFYTEWLFSGTSQDVPDFQLNSLCYLLQMHSGSPTSLAILLVHLLEVAELGGNLCLTQGDVMVHVGISDEEGYMIDPTNGQQSWYIIPENANEDDSEPLELVIGEEILKLFLAQQKWAFIGAEKFGHALSCVDMLMSLLGNDPYERRDRGYLLNQLDCPKMAKEDLQFFVDECPDDPTIELIQMQIAELSDYNNILH
ncbi:tetratricopeptide repeat protein [Pseudoalteromonas xiamenensis]|uniref:tetratricopeptide repeat protein n=1 Tax=Pseudoalteromonas xiamenensis TaxID=882626 RepID=UPI0027E43554|nr:tetratricopeptide repeat protein [Pseudoalteromonas xiamenensis]WMN59448.1 tetratricopeptide repeat protein [Pseudoalteromonas xiamenensis]